MAQSTSRRPSTARAGAALVATAAALVVLTGCDLPGESQLDFSSTEKVKINQIRLGPGGSGYVKVRTADIAEVRINRMVRYRGAEPGRTYRVEGTVLHADTNCGRMCSVSYDIEAPTGVVVRGDHGSGDLTLTNVGSADVRVGSGTIVLSGGSGAMVAQTGSGDITATDLHGPVTLRAGSGDISARGIGGAPVSADTGSGNVNLTLDRASGVRVHTGSGDVTLTVPAGSYRVLTDTSSGDRRVGVPNDPNGQHTLQLDTGSGNITVSRG